MTSRDEDEIIRAIAENLIRQYKKKWKSIALVDAISEAQTYVENIHGITSRVAHIPADTDGFVVRLLQSIEENPSLQHGFIKTYDITADEEVDMAEIIATLLYMLLALYPDLYTYYMSKYDGDWLYWLYMDYNSTH